MVFRFWRGKTGMREDINHTKNEIDLYWRAANYLTVAQIFLQDNLTMERELRFNDLTLLYNFINDTPVS